LNVNRKKIWDRVFLGHGPGDKQWHRKFSDIYYEEVCSN
jgi:hypothetical protein